MAQSMTRRQALAATACSATALASEPLVTRQNTSANRTVVVGVMGLKRGLELAKTFASQPGVVVKYLCDVDSQRAASACEAIHRESKLQPESITDFRRILDDPQVDALVCAAPNHWHAPATILACASGKHVYVEKPCSHNPWEGEKMIEAARKHDRLVQIGTQRRSDPYLQQAIARLREGVIGRVYSSQSWYNNRRTSIGIGKQDNPPAYLDYELWQGPAPRVPYSDNRIPYNWHWFWHWGNGELGNNGVHALDVARWGLGVDFPTSVVSSGGRYRFDDDQQTPDTQTTVFEFPGGKQATFQSLSCNNHKRHHECISFYGEQGTMEIGWNRGFRIWDAGDKLIDEVKPRESDAMQAAEFTSASSHIANFNAAIRSGDRLELNAEIDVGHKSTLLCHLGNIAYRTQNALKCDPRNGHILDNDRAMNLWKREYEDGWEPIV